VGSADFVGGVKQSRATLKPAGLFAGNDHAMPLRENAAYVAQSYNRVIVAGRLHRADGTSIPAVDPSAQQTCKEQSHLQACMRHVILCGVSVRQERADLSSSSQHQAVCSFRGTRSACSSTRSEAGRGVR
jgi:hypothetical protein